MGVAALYYIGKKYYFIKIQRAEALQMKNIKYFTNEIFYLFFLLCCIRKIVVPQIGLSSSPHILLRLLRYNQV